MAPIENGSCSGCHTRLRSPYIAQVREALKYDIDAIYFGDDWGQQRGLQMGPATWRKFIYPVLRRMYGEVRRAGKLVMIHSCGDVDELFDDLVAAGLNCFNPFQPEVMDIHALLPRYRGRAGLVAGRAGSTTCGAHSRTGTKPGSARSRAGRTSTWGGWP